MAIFFSLNVIWLHRCEVLWMEFFIRIVIEMTSFLLVRCDYKLWFFLPSKNLSSNGLKTRQRVVNCVNSAWPWLIVILGPMSGYLSWFPSNYGRKLYNNIRNKHNARDHTENHGLVYWSSWEAWPVLGQIWLLIYKSLGPIQDAILKSNAVKSLGMSLIQNMVAIARSLTLDPWA